VLGKGPFQVSAIAFFILNPLIFRNVNAQRSGEESGEEGYVREGAAEAILPYVRKALIKSM